VHHAEMLEDRRAVVRDERLARGGLDLRTSARTVGAPA